MGLQQRRSGETRRLLYEIAMRHFLDRGYEHTSIDGIVTDADVAKGTFFRHFPTKAAVLEQWAREWFAEVAAAAAIDSTAPLLENLLKLVDAMARTGREYLELTGWLIVDSHTATLRKQEGKMRTATAPEYAAGTRPTAPAEDGTHDQEGLSPMACFVAGLIADAPPAQDVDAPRAAEALINSWFGTILFCLGNPDRDPQEMLAYATRVWYAGAVGAEGGPDENARAGAVDGVGAAGGAGAAGSPEAAGDNAPDMPRGGGER
jgi:AcrR family transcriptional regulator